MYYVSDKARAFEGGQWLGIGFTLIADYGMSSYLVLLAT